MKKRLALLLSTILCIGLANAQWRDTKHHLVLTAMAGGTMGLGSSTKASSYQLIGRGMYYPRRIIALGAEAGFTQTFGQYQNADVGAVNGFVHAKLPLGFYAEGGLGAVGSISDGRSYSTTNAGVFWSLGYAKSLGSHVALELQYRNAPSFQESDEKNYQRGFRLGLSLKL